MGTFKRYWQALLSSDQSQFFKKKFSLILTDLAIMLYKARHYSQSEGFELRVANLLSQGQETKMKETEARKRLLKFRITNLYQTAQCKMETVLYRICSSALDHIAVQYPMISAESPLKFKKIKIKMENNGFIFEIIVPRIVTKKECLDPKKLSVDVIFHRIALTVNSNLINISEFPEKPGFHFYAALEEVKYMVTTMPILFIVKYGDEILGISETTWPQTSVTHIHSAMVEIFHVGECVLNLEDQKVGHMEFVVRIRKKCDSFEKQQSYIELNSNFRDLTNREANDPNLGSKETESERRASVEENTLGNFETTEPCPDPRTCEITKLMEMLNQVGKPKEDCTYEPIECHDCVEGMFDTGSSDISSSDDDEHSSLRSEIPCWLCSDDQIPPPPDLTSNILIPPRHCLLCNQNMASLPKLAACPNCGYEPKPLIKEELYNNERTAYDIIEEYGLNEENSESEEYPKKKTSKNKKNRCKCGNTNKCAFCRVQKIGLEMMLAARGKTIEDYELKCGKCQNEKTPSIYNICKNNDENCRPYLAKVFSELRVLYEIRSRPKPTKQQLLKACEKEIRSEFEKWHIKKIALTAASQNQLQHQKTQVPKDKNNQNLKQKNKNHNDRNLRNCKQRIPTHGPHQKCFEGLKSCEHVPKRMGWLWTSDPRKKWRPGLIGKRIRRIMNFFLHFLPTTTAEAKKLAYEHCKKICEERKVIPPTLHVEKKEDAYYVTLYRHANPASLQDCMEPCNQDGKPITFKIVKHPKLILYRHLKRKFKDMGFSKCVCHRPISECVCRSFLEKKHLEFAVKKECCKRQIPCVNNDLVLSKTSISEADFDFEVKPPAAVVKPSSTKQVKMVSTGSQYVPTDIVLTPPGAGQKEVGRFLATYDCTVGEKYGKPCFIPYPGQNIPGMEWRKAIREQKRNERAAQIANKIYKIGTVKEKYPKIVEAPIPFGENGPPKIAKDGTALDENDKPLVDADGNAYMITRKMDGSFKIEKKKKKPLNMIKYLTAKGLLVAKDKGRNPRPIPPGGISPEYLAMQRALRRQKYLELLEQTPVPVCMVDRLGKPGPTHYFEC